MARSIKYAHTNLIARDWKSLSKFYIEVFSCEPINPQRKLSGAWLDQITGLQETKIEGIHLRLPGYDSLGPTLEIFQYLPPNHVTEKENRLHEPGFGHIAFQVANVGAMLEKAIAHKGQYYGKVVEKKYPELSKMLTITYLKDPEGNFIELQKWLEY